MLTESAMTGSVYKLWRSRKREKRLALSAGASAARADPGHLMREPDSRLSSLWTALGPFSPVLTRRACRCDAQVSEQPPITI